MLNVAIQNHTMMVVELDGEPVVPVSVASLDLHVGQRAGVVVVADQAPDVYWISIKVRGRPSVRFGAAVIRYTTAAVPPGSEPREQALLALRKSQPAWDDIAFTLAQQREFEHPDAANAPSSVAERISILSTQERFAPGETSHVPDPPLPNDPNLIGQGDQRPENYCDGSGGKLLKWASARVPHQETRTPVLLSLYYQTPSMQELGRSKGQFLLQLGQTYDIVLQNYPACNGVCETHPWHMHGHHFWVVGTWPGEFNGTLPTEGTGGKLYRRDTIMIIGEGEDHRPTTRRGCGFTVIRFVANNPGAWPFHCHAEWHQIMGMGVTLYYPSNTIPAPRSADHSICGDVTPEIAAARHQTDRGPQTNVKFAVELLWLANARYHPVILVVAGLPLAIIAFLVKRRWDFGAHRGAENSARGEHLDSDAAISRTERAISGTDKQSAEPKEQAVEADRFRV
jgi:L-ascorbate oxidase